MVVLSTDIIHMLDPSGAPRNINFDEPISTFDARYMLMRTAAKTGAYIATVDDCVILCDASGGAFIVTLPAVSGNAGLNLHIKKTDSSGNAITVDGDGAETIDGVITALLITQYESITILCDGSEWWIL